MKFATKLIHAGIRPDPATGAIMTPIFQTSTYVQEAPGKHKGFEYARTQNPTRQALEENLAALEGGEAAVCFSSGMAAMDAIIKLLKPGDEVLATNDIYGGSYRLLVKVFKKFGIRSKFIDFTDPSFVAEHITENTRLLWIETPTNPMLKIFDIRAISDLAVGKNIIVCVDNTFASPYLQEPIALGAELVVHSATKYLGGHSDTIHGAVVCKSRALADELYFLQNAVGAVPGPMDCFLVLRGIKTLHLRVQRSCDNAKAVAHFLRSHPKVAHVVYPGFEDHPQHQIAKSQMRDFGAMVSFDMVNNCEKSAFTLLSGTHIFSLAESLGGVESLIGHPASMTHAAIPREKRIAVGLTDSLIRMSIGVEDVDDLIEDLDQALKKVE